MNNHFSDRLFNEISKAIELNDIEKYKNILTDNSFDLTRDEKEKQVFIGTYINFNYFKRGKIFIEYLIYNYKIDRKNSFDLVEEDKEFEKMFLPIILHDELASKRKDENYKKSAKIKL